MQGRNALSSSHMQHRAAPQGTDLRLGGVRPAARRVRCRAPHVAPADKLVVLDIESCVEGLEEVVTVCAHRAAKKLWPSSTVAQTPPGAYTRTMRQLLPATAAPEEAVLLIRLLADEGIVGARSTAGREGPVVGRAVRRSGSRPLLVAEVLENWESDVKAACVVRWSREGSRTGTVEELQEEVRQRYLEELRAYGGSSSSGKKTSSSSDDDQGADPWAALRPRGRVVDAVNSAAVPVLIVSTLPEHITAAALQRAGIVCAGATGSGGSGSPGAACSIGLLQSRCLEDAARSAAEKALATCVQLHVVVDRLGRAEALREVLRPQLAPAAATAAAAAASAAAVALAGGEVLPPPSASSSGASGLGRKSASGSGGQRQQLPSPAPSVYVADWCCVSASQRAAAGTGLLPDHRLVDLLGCSDSALVMDGIAWR